MPDSEQSVLPRAAGAADPHPRRAALKRHSAGVCAVSVLLVLGCSDATETPPAAPRASADAAIDASLLAAAPDAGGTSRAGEPPDAASKSPSLDAGQEGHQEEHQSFETAHELEVDESVLQLIYTAGEATYFSFHASAGAFYVMSTENSPFSPDNTLRVFDAERRPVAVNESGSLWPGDYVDTRLIFHAPAAGEYFVRVQDESYMSEDAGIRFSSPLSYHFMVRGLHGGLRGFAQQDPGAAVTPVQLIEDDNGKHAYVTVFGLLERGQRASFELSSKPNQALIGQLLAAGASGNGSTATALHVTTSAQTDGHVLASTHQHDGFSPFHPPLNSGSYRVTVEQPQDAGDNGFYALDLVLLDDNPVERAETQNGTLSGAEPIDLTGSQRRRGRVLSRLPKGDVDYYRFELAASEQMFAVCEAESGGSGVRGLRASFLDGSEQPLRAQTEPSPMNLLLDVVRVDKPGTYFLKLQADAPAVENTAEIEPWVRCAVTVGQ